MKYKIKIQIKRTSFSLCACLMRGTSGLVFLVWKCLLYVCNIWSMDDTLILASVLSAGSSYSKVKNNIKNYPVKMLWRI